MLLDLIPREVVYSVLRLQLPQFAVACVIAVAGICSLWVAALKIRDGLFLSTGVISLLYSLRLFVQNELVRDAFAAPDAGYVTIQFALTFAINIPFAFFALKLLGHGWKRSIQVWLWLCIAFAAIAIPYTLVTRNFDLLGQINNLLVMSGTILLFAHVLAARRRGDSLAAALFWPLLLFAAFVLLENYGFTAYGQHIEPVGFVILLAGLGAVAIKRALAAHRKLTEVEQELATARRIQFSILPEAPPTVDGLQIAARYQPMTSVAGDYYDFQVSGDLVTILVADVSGHGVPAALVACMLKVCFAAQRANMADPAAILSGLARMLSGSLGGQYITAACATIDTKSRTITYAGAGHPPSILTQKTTATFLDKNGLFVGPFPFAVYENMSVPFGTGDRLLLYTDGITEAQNADGGEFGREALKDFVARSAHAQPESTLDDLFRHLGSNPAQDDLTAVLVHFA